MWTGHTQVFITLLKLITTGDKLAKKITLLEHTITADTFGTGLLTLCTEGLLFWTCLKMFIKAFLFVIRAFLVCSLKENLALHWFLMKSKVFLE